MRSGAISWIIVELAACARVLEGPLLKWGSNSRLGRHAEETPTHVTHLRLPSSVAKSESWSEGQVNQFVLTMTIRFCKLSAEKTRGLALQSDVRRVRSEDGVLK